MAEIAGVSNFLEYVVVLLPLEKYINKRVKVQSDGTEGFVRSIYNEKLQVYIIDGDANPRELLPTDVDIVTAS